jgi:hypothetical protein
MADRAGAWMIARINGAGHIAEILVDAAELVWNTYGVSSKIGRHAERALHRAQELACALDDSARARTRPNRFVFTDYRHGQRLPGMSREQHIALGNALKDCGRLAATQLVASSSACGKSHRYTRAWVRMARLCSVLQCKLDDLACREHANDECLFWYYGARA